AQADNDPAGTPRCNQGEDGHSRDSSLHDQVPGGRRIHKRARWVPWVIGTRGLDPEANEAQGQHRTDGHTDGDADVGPSPGKSLAEPRPFFRRRRTLGYLLPANFLPGRVGTAHRIPELTGRWPSSPHVAILPHERKRHLEGDVLPQVSALESL